ncbi:hypothetical protein E8E14_003094 [Neopestalotiopsis sp. 37M]|nr:hypothetical protein E8E14_003094 [Neopestalotiopsis sp. 37M]
MPTPITRPSYTTGLHPWHSVSNCTSTSRTEMGLSGLKSAHIWLSVADAAYKVQEVGLLSVMSLHQTCIFSLLHLEVTQDYHVRQLQVGPTPDQPYSAIDPLDPPRSRR